MIDILIRVFILITTMVDVYVLSGIVMEPRWAVFGIAIAPKCWFIAAIAMSLVIFIFFLIDTYRKKMAYNEYVAEVLACHQVEMEILWEEMNYIKEHALIIDS